MHSERFRMTQTSSSRFRASSIACEADVHQSLTLAARGLFSLNSNASLAQGRSDAFQLLAEHYRALWQSVRVDVACRAEFLDFTQQVTTGAFKGAVPFKQMLNRITNRVGCQDR